MRFSVAYAALSEGEWGYRESLDLWRQRSTSWSSFETQAILRLGSDPVWREVSIRRDATIRHNRLAQYLVVFLVVHVEMWLSLLDLNGKDFCLAYLAVFVSIRFTTHSKIVYCGYGWIWGSGPIVRSSGPSAIRSIVGHQKAGPA